MASVAHRPHTAMLQGDFKFMQKARLHLSPMEREYISIYKELPEIILQKNPVNGSDILEKRMDDIWKRMKERHNQSNVSELEKEGCPWAT